MYGGFGSWLYSSIAGISRAPGSRGWSNLLFNPAVGASPNITLVTSSIDTPVGLVAVKWTSAVDNTGQCGLVPENAVMNLTCVTKSGAPGNFTSVNFASFGTPQGSCPTFSTGTCNSANSMSVVSSLCLGKSTCSIPATNAQFGGDPCLNTVKALAVALEGDCLEVQYQISTTVPVSSQATVVVNLAGSPANSVTVMEGSTPVWMNGTYVPGVPGVTGASVTPDGTAIGVATGSGNYVFSVAK